MFAEQIDTITAQLEKPNEYPHPIIYRSLINPELYNGRPTPSRASLLEEAIALVIAGTDTTGATMTIGTYQLLRNPEKYQRLKTELKEAWPNLSDRPRCEVIEKLPYLVRNTTKRHCLQWTCSSEPCAPMLIECVQTAVIKEALRLAPTTTSENSRMVPPEGTTIGGRFVPGSVSLWPCCLGS